MSIRIRTVANRAKTLNEVLAIGVKRPSPDESNDVNQILKSFFAHEDPTAPLCCASDPQ